jgi:hypothetical protein
MRMGAVPGHLAHAILVLAFYLREALPGFSILKGGGIIAGF